MPRLRGVTRTTAAEPMTSPMSPTAGLKSPLDGVHAGRHMMSEVSLADFVHSVGTLGNDVGVSKATLLYQPRPEPETEKDDADKAMAASRVHQPRPSKPSNEPTMEEMLRYREIEHEFTNKVIIEPQHELFQNMLLVTASLVSVTALLGAVTNVLPVQLYLPWLAIVLVVVTFNQVARRLRPAVYTSDEEWFRFAFFAACSLALIVTISLLPLPSFGWIMYVIWLNALMFQRWLRLVNSAILIASVTLVSSAILLVFGLSQAVDPIILCGVFTNFFVALVHNVSSGYFGEVVLREDYVHNRIIKTAHSMSTQLLKNSLPERVTKILLKAEVEGEEEAETGNEEDNVIADECPATTVMFCCVKGLPEYKDKTLYVKDLDKVYSAFDDLVLQHPGTEKMKTISEVYMVGAGIPDPNESHVEVIMDLALAMRKKAHYLNLKYADCEWNLALQIGINSGPVTAGVIGREKFLYDIWGDTVNTASRMYSTGELHKIQVTGATQALVADQFLWTHRGKVVVKGKGELDTWWLEDRVPMTRPPASFADTIAAELPPLPPVETVSGILRSTSETSGSSNSSSVSFQSPAAVPGTVNDEVPDDLPDTSTSTSIAARRGKETVPALGLGAGGIPEANSNATADAGAAAPVVAPSSNRLRNPARLVSPVVSPYSLSRSRPAQKSRHLLPKPSVDTLPHTSRKRSIEPFTLRYRRPCTRYEEKFWQSLGGPLWLENGEQQSTGSGDQPYISRTKEIKRKMASRNVARRQHRGRFTAYAVGSLIVWMAYNLAMIAFDVWLFPASSSLLVVLHAVQVGTAGVVLCTFRSPWLFQANRRLIFGINLAIATGLSVAVLCILPPPTSQLQVYTLWIYLSPYALTFLFQSAVVGPGFLPAALIRLTSCLAMVIGLSIAWATSTIQLSGVLAPAVVIVLALATVYLSRQWEIDLRMNFLQLEQYEKHTKKPVNLLHNIIPPAIVRAIKNDRNNEGAVEAHYKCSVLAMDVVGFTKWSSGLEAKELVRVLNKLYSVFDDTAKWESVEKIKTLGDAYVAAAGIPESNSKHCKALIGFAIKIRENVKVFNRENGTDLHFRFGLASGWAIGGVIGKIKFHYDIWGDAVEQAFLQESNGETDEIQVNERFARSTKQWYIYDPVYEEGQGPDSVDDNGKPVAPRSFRLVREKMKSEPECELR